jgi:hypothetical protein
MRIIEPWVGRKVLTVAEKIAIYLGYSDLVTFADERCRGAAGNRELPIDYLGRARDRLRADPERYYSFINICYERAIGWCWRGKGNKDKLVRFALIHPENVLLRDDELAKRLRRKHYGARVDRPRVNVLRHELWAELLLVKDEVVW